MAQWPYSSAKWQRLRRLHLQLEPLCRGCLPRLVPANVVDHVVPISAGGPAFPGHEGLRSYCPTCHSAKTARGSEAGAVRSNKPRRGCDADGKPLDPGHPWAEGPQLVRNPSSNCRPVADGLGPRVVLRPYSHAHRGASSSRPCDLGLQPGLAEEEEAVRRESSGEGTRPPTRRTAEKSLRAEPEGPQLSAEEPGSGVHPNRPQPERGAELES